MLLYWLYSYCFDTKSINCEVSALFSAADRCFPRARLQPPREAHSVGSSDTCYSRRTRKATAAFASHEENWFVFSRSQRSSAPNNHRKSKIDPIVRCQT